MSDSSDGDDTGPGDSPPQPAEAGDAPRSPATDDPTDPDKIETNLAFLREAFPDEDDMVRGDWKSEEAGRGRAGRGILSGMLL